MLKEDQKSLFAPTFQQDLNRDSSEPARLTIIRGAKNLVPRPVCCTTTHGLHLVNSKAGELSESTRLAPPAFRAPVPFSVVKYGNPFLLRTMWIASVICYAGVLVWFAN